MQVVEGTARGREASRPSSATSLAMRIVDLVIRQGLDEGAHITEQWVAGELGLSRSPVRKALAFLAELGIVERIPNRGFFLTRSASSLEQVDLDAASEAEEAGYFQLVDDHLRGRLASEFTAAEVTRRYGLSPRQAQRLLARLEGEDLVRRRPGRGWEFHKVLSTVEGHDQSYRFRMIVEPAALLEPGFAVDADAFAEHRARQEALLRGRILTLPRRELFRTGAEFHEMVVGCSGNVFLLDALRRQNRVRRLIEYRHQFDRSRLVGQAREHLRLLELMERGELQAAAELLRAHLDRVRWLKTGIGPEPPPPVL
ncbi:transcriptional regulator, GntR family [Marinactinospora thermotolerans DSM 45154]|uniref:Transcriptional regulator, GntR family n=1 Tax=Marinactinospora thermotolerans DSM 45154 TaxID=1122192 RepID=A0A1T4KLT9_9ACTN|nr:GntR family transcriptional regulator [Marinactinospora thermotolerans]SJZ43365.1 transcriptional regulator, GntR family [Marinactinospora thermotolerans DSM 45154]